MCKLCQLADGNEDEHVTEWYFLGVEGEVPEEFQGAVVRDVDDDGYALRLLWVPRKHVSKGEETREMCQTARVMLLGVAQAVAVEYNLVLVRLDFKNSPREKHWHARALLDVPQEALIGLIHVF